VTWKIACLVVLPKLAFSQKYILAGNALPIALVQRSVGRKSSWMTKNGIAENNAFGLGRAAHQSAGFQATLTFGKDDWYCHRTSTSVLVITTRYAHKRPTGELPDSYHSVNKNGRTCSVLELLFVCGLFLRLYRLFFGAKALRLPSTYSFRVFAMAVMCGVLIRYVMNSTGFLLWRRSDGEKKKKRGGKGGVREKEGDSAILSAWTEKELISAKLPPCFIIF